MWKSTGEHWIYSGSATNDLAAEIEKQYMTLREMGIVVRNTVLGATLESVAAFVGEPKAAVYYATECRFLYRALFPTRGLPSKPVWEALGAEQVPVVLYGQAAGEWFRPVASFTADLISMCMLCQIAKPQVIFEIGTFHGSGALHWAGNAPEAEIYTLDLPTAAEPSLSLTSVDRMHIQGHSQSPRMAFEGKPEADRIHCLYGDSATFDYSPFFRKVDLFFIDGAHSYEYVRNDTERAFECCKPGGLVVWHDYGRVGFNGVARRLHELSSRGREIHRVPGGSLAYTKA
jgi:predicted O-methyltransferase YrrM